MDQKFLDTLHDHQRLIRGIDAKISSLVISCDEIGLKVLANKLADYRDLLNQSTKTLVDTYTKSLHDFVTKQRKEVGENLSAMIKGGTYPNRDNG